MIINRAGFNSSVLGREQAGFITDLGPGGVIGSEELPPIIDSLLVWLKGNDDGDTQKLDSWKKPYAENWTMSGSHCIALNGTDEFGTLDIPVTLVGDCVISWRYEYVAGGIAAPALWGDSATLDGLLLFVVGDVMRLRINAINYDFATVLKAGTNWELSRTGTSITLSNELSSETITASADDIVIGNIGTRNSAASSVVAGNIYDVRLQDSTRDIHFRLAEGPADGTNATSFSDDYENDGLYITWTGIPANMWAQRQDSYHGNAVDGWWEISGDLIKYPYPVAGFDTFHRGGTFNNCETSYGPKEFPAGTANGVDNTLTMLADHGTIVSHGTLDTSVPTYTHPTITLTAGIIRDILFSDGMLMQVREGTGTNLYDSDNNLVATLNGDAAFWEGEHMVSEEIILAEIASTSGNYLTDGLGHRLPMTQQAWDELGAELVENGDLSNGNAGWSINGTPTTAEVNQAKPYIGNSSYYILGAAINDGVYTNNIPIELTKSYKVSCRVFIVSGQVALKRYSGLGIFTEVPSSGTGRWQLLEGIMTVATAGNEQMFIRDLVGSSEFYVDAMTVREVNQVMNNNLQYYFGDNGVLIYKDPRTTEEDTEIKTYQGII